MIPGAIIIFKPVTASTVAYKRTAEDEDIQVTFNITGEANNVELKLDQLKLNDYVACRYGGKWWIGLVEELNRLEQNVQMNFLHPHGTSRSFLWPTRHEICWVFLTEIMCLIGAPGTATGRTYNISEAKLLNINKQFLL